MASKSSSESEVSLDAGVDLAEAVGGQLASPRMLRNFRWASLSYLTVKAISLTAVMAVPMGRSTLCCCVYFQHNYLDSAAPHHRVNQIIWVRLISATNCLHSHNSTDVTSPLRPQWVGNPTSLFRLCSLLYLLTYYYQGGKPPWHLVNITTRPRHSHLQHQLILQYYKYNIHSTVLIKLLQATVGDPFLILPPHTCMQHGWR